MKSCQKFLILFILTLFLHISFVQISVAQNDPGIKIFNEQGDSIVLIGTKGKKKNTAGTGFLVGDKGIILTNYHVVAGARKLFVKLKNNTGFTHVRLLAFDVEKDIAVLKVSGSHLKGVTLGNSSQVEIGQRVLTIGNPLGFENSIADGLISSVRTIDRMELFQISVPLSSGSSGGPLFDMNGEVVGITTAASSKGQNLNFAIPINYVKPLLKKVGYKDSSATKKYSRKEQPRTTPEVKLDRTAMVSTAATYTVKPKDTLYGLARKFHISVEDLMSANQLEHADIYTGQLLKIPGR